MKNKRGVSPIIATVLLIVIVVILAMIIFLWARSFVGEAIQKKNKPIEQSCGEVNLELSYREGVLYATNKGNIPIYNLEISKKSGASIDTQNSGKGITLGASLTVNVGPDYDEIEVFPVILGQTETGKKSYICENNPFRAYS